MAWLSARRIEMFATRRRLDEARPATRTYDPPRPETALFAYSRFDQKHLFGLEELFRHHGARLRPDEGDARMQAALTARNDQWHRETFGELRRVVLLVSNASKASRWMPWLLGWVHGHAGGIDRVALMPISEAGDEEPFASEAYFGLYPRVQSVDDELQVVDPADGRYWSLADWLGAAGPGPDLFA